MEILWVWVGKQRGYYVADRSFSVPELRILIDAVRAANFITEKKTDQKVIFDREGCKHTSAG
ncbi:MAG: hypothetical protein LUE29_02840 [Lachnospiraceae bacterium]|nr:hypothetical protein [Lachnospiraceae bacterium]